MKDKKKKIITIVGIVSLLLIVIGASYAYFIAQIGSGASTNVTIEADTVDSLQFTTSGELDIKLNQDNFASGGGNKKGNTTATATLIAGTNRTPSFTYNVYLAISTNEFNYTTSDKKPELILRITTPTGALTTFEGLTYNSSLNGFDITEKDGLITLASNYTITTSSTLRHNWKVEVEAINLDSDQSGNAGSKFDAELIIQQNELVTLASHIKSLYTSQGSNGLYLHDSSLANSAEDGSYRYSGASDSVNNYVCFGSDAATCSTDNLYRIIGVFGDRVKLIKSDYTTETHLGADGDNFYDSSYTTSGVSTYKGNLTSVRRYFFNYNGLPDKTINNGKGSNDWETSLLNKTNLNTNYINYLNIQDSKWTNMISNNKWNIGGITINAIPAKGFYDLEKAKQTSVSSKISIMQISDYGFATIPSNWNTNLNSYNSVTIIDNNWMYMGLDEWVITPLSDYASGTMHVAARGGVFGEVSNNTGYAVRPVFYLKISTPYISGEGTSSNPYRIS